MPNQKNIQKRNRRSTSTIVGISNNTKIKPLSPQSHLHACKFYPQTAQEEIVQLLQLFAEVHCQKIEYEQPQIYSSFKISIKGVCVSHFCLRMKNQQSQNNKNIQIHKMNVENENKKTVKLLNLNILSLKHTIEDHLRECVQFRHFIVDHFYCRMKQYPLKQVHITIVLRYVINCQKKFSLWYMIH